MSCKLFLIKFVILWDMTPFSSYVIINTLFGNNLLPSYPGSSETAETIYVIVPYTAICRHDDLETSGSLRATAVTGLGTNRALKSPAHVSPVTGVILLSQNPFTEIAVKLVFISAICSVTHLVLTLLAGMWALQALLSCLLFMRATASSGLPGESQQFNTYRHSCIALPGNYPLHVSVVRPSSGGNIHRKLI
jgi:hypothetical protein